MNRDQKAKADRRARRLPSSAFGAVSPGARSDATLTYSERAAHGLGALRTIHVPTHQKKKD